MDDTNGTAGEKKGVICSNPVDKGEQMRKHLILSTVSK